MKKKSPKEVKKATPTQEKTATNDTKRVDKVVGSPSVDTKILESYQKPIREFHLFAGIGGGIYGGELLGHKCCGGVEIMPYAQGVLRQRQEDGWMPKFPIYGDLCKLSGNQFKETFDVLCGGFPCQAFSTAAHGKNIASKNLWGEMFRFIQESNAPIVFGENVVSRALEKAKNDLENVGYKVEVIKLSCGDIGADHQRNRFWLLAYNDNQKFQELANRIKTLPRLTGRCWEQSPDLTGDPVPILAGNRREQLLGVGNAQSPFAAATAFRILVNRLLNPNIKRVETPSNQEIASVFEKSSTWMQRNFNNIGFVHTPTTMANYACPSMMKHQGCRNFTEVFGRPEPLNAEYLMGFPIGASSPNPQSRINFDRWRAQ